MLKMAENGLLGFYTDDDDGNSFCKVYGRLSSPL